MAGYAYTNYDIDLAGQKRQRIGQGGEYLLTADKEVPTDSVPHTVYDPVRDSQNHTDDMPLADVDLSGFNFTNPCINDSSLWYPDQGQQLFQESYNFDDQTFLLSNQTYYQTSTAEIISIFQEDPDETTADSTQDSTQRTSLDLSPFSQIGELVAPVLDVICFGMIADIPVHCNQSGSLLVESASLPLKFFRPNTLRHISPNQNGEFGSLEDRTAKIFANLLAENDVHIQLYSRNISRRSVMKAKGSRKSGSKVSQSLINAIIYGPEDICEPTGKYLTECRMFLQDPVQNDRDVVYRNPHILSRTEEVVLISELSIEVSDAKSKGLEDPHDFFSELSKDDHLSLTEAPDAISTKLYPHQKKALTFMMQREQPWTFEGLEGDLWVKEADETGGIVYANLITGSSQSSAPGESKGGLLADKMGLGKSLSMISLIALNPMQSKEKVIFTSQGTIRRVKSTLIVVPYSLLKTWDTQLEKLEFRTTRIYKRLIDRHLKSRALSWIRFHRPAKRKMLSFSTYDIVITTYETLVSQQKRHRDSKYGDTLFSFAWHRIVLDEAHTIRNRATSMAQACQAIRATSRWAMTGTPIQNRMSDFASLLEYLHIYPFSNHKIFETEIMKPFLSEDERDVSRMRKLVNCISLCRTKSVIDLPERVDETCFLDFSPGEREHYDEAKYSTIHRIDEAVSHKPLAPNQYLNALQWLNELRLICNHGLVRSRKCNEKKTVTIVQDEPWNHKSASRAFETLVKAGEAMCAICKEYITEGTGEAANSEFSKPSLSRCLTMICGSCTQIKIGAQKILSCACTPKCPKVDVSWAPESVETRSEERAPVMKPEDASTKLKALLERLQKSPKDEKSVVFSYWTFTLDLIEILLRAASISFTRIDGKQTGGQRDIAIEKFETDDSIQVMLVSITCGGTGLDLTAASIAYLLEPQWNPMIEEQALCRIHRLGQQKKVRTVRFQMKNSFEEKIAVIQQEKKELAAGAFSDEERAEAASDKATRLQAMGESLRDY